jgi:DNA polymerase-3 subunit epsilon
VIEGRAVFLDLETTGAHPVHDRIIEIALIECESGRPIGEWATLVHPGRSIPPAIRALTGLTDEKVALAPRFAEIAPELRARLEGRVLVAHNARFDYGFLLNEFRRAGLRFRAPLVCTLRLSRRLYPAERRHHLDALIERHGLACEARHRALGDARVLCRLLEVWRREHGAEALRAAVAQLLAEASVPAGLPAGILEEIPDGPGVYLFYGENELPLYVGKSVRLRARVQAHFAAQHRDGRDAKIGRQVRRIEWIETAGELGALVEEARLVKRLAPLHNRRLRSTAELCSWRWRFDPRSAAPELVGADALEAEGWDDLYGLFRSQAAARQALREIAAERGLCPLLLGLEKGRAPCFARQIRRCRGACAGEESRTAHALRLAEALAPLRLKPWPFRGPVAVRERGAQVLIVLDRWRCLGTARSHAELEALARSAAPFDPDTYRILVRFFARPRPDCEIVELSASGRARGPAQ